MAGEQLSSLLITLEEQKGEAGAASPASLEDESQRHLELVFVELGAAAGAVVFVDLVVGFDGQLGDGLEGDAEGCRLRENLGLVRACHINRY
uniref:Uncharacterized protein n=1 Tax=Geobacter sp. (strain M21) TaxID=443144 RepID=C6DZ12_GEOSM